MQMKLDRTDLKILELLQQNASLSAAEIAEQVGLSQSPCWRRIHRLEELGIIAARVALLDRRRLGLRTPTNGSCATGCRGSRRSSP